MITSFAPLSGSSRLVRRNDFASSNTDTPHTQYLGRDFKRPMGFVKPTIARTCVRRVRYQSRSQCLQDAQCRVSEVTEGATVRGVALLADGQGQRTRLKDTT